VNRGRRTSEIVDLIDFDVERETYIVTHKFEVRISEKMLHIASCAGVEIVDTQDVIAARQQLLT
jgi:hypothetical protein